MNSAKACDIPKALVWDAYLDVKRKAGGPRCGWAEHEGF